MNVSLQDGYNIGWKLASVLRNESPSRLLQTYVSERQKTAEDLIDFDRHFTKMFSTTYREQHGITPDDFTQHFVKSGRYMAGQGIRYKESLIVSSDPQGDVNLTNLVVGMRFPSAQVVRYSDARAMQLVRALPADGRWHVVVFSGDLLDPDMLEKTQKVPISAIPKHEQQK
jgi:phenol 2-monooxygenase (NADPH)